MTPTTREIARAAHYWAWQLTNPEAVSQWVLTEFNAWIQISPEHARQFHLAMARYALSSELGPLSPDELEEWRERAKHIRASISRQHPPSSIGEVVSRPTVQQDRDRGRIASIGESLATVIARRPRTIAMLLAVLLLTVGALIYRIDPTWTIYVTTSGPESTVRLEDGSALTLAAQSTGDFRSSHHLREFRLRKGSATFDVVHDSTRPFKVAVSGGTIEALGTRFTVSVNDTRSTIEVQNGLVRVTGTTFSDLRPGQRAWVLPDGSIRVDRGGELVHARPLAEIAASLNERRKVPQLVIEGQACNMELSGRWDFDKPELFDRWLENRDDFEIAREGNTLRVRKRDDHSPAGQVCDTK
jgi:ferric-dicitrate binding protein FerR (iron transport regulator)